MTVLYRLQYNKNKNIGHEFLQSIINTYKKQISLHPHKINMSVIHILDDAASAYVFGIWRTIKVKYKYTNPTRSPSTGLYVNPVHIVIQSPWLSY